MLKVALPTYYLLTGDNYVNQNCLITPQLNKTNLQLPLILLQNGSETSNKSKSKNKKEIATLIFCICKMCYIIFRFDTQYALL